MSALCPRCHGPLELSRDGVDARTCPGCHGMLMRHADLGRAVENGSGGTEEHARAERAREDPVLRCPDCGRPMEKHGYMGIRALQIDDCSECGLVWVDAGELARMRAAVASTSEHRRARDEDDRLAKLAPIVPAEPWLDGSAERPTAIQSWRILRWSAGVLRRDGEIAVFALLSLLGQAIIAGAACLTLGAPPPPGAPPGDLLEYGVGLLALLLALNVVDTFFDCAIVTTTLARLQGSNPTLEDALSVASIRLPVILGWALYSTIVGVMIGVARGLIERQGGFVGRLASRAAGFAWSVATFLVVPIIVVEEKGPEAALERSVALLKRTWGEQIVFRFSFRALSFVLFLPTVALLLAGSAARAAAPGGVRHLALWGVAAAYYLSLQVLQSSLQVIFRGALYYVAVTQRVPAGLDHTVFGIGPAARAAAAANTA